MSTPVRTPGVSPVAAPATDSPGTWRHPRLNEITRRREKTTFTEKNVHEAVFHFSSFVLLIAVQMVAKLKSVSSIVPLSMRNGLGWILLALELVCLANVGIAIMPYFRTEDDLADIPLTPAQRKLLGLPPTVVAPTPDAHFSTPPRYSRTPSISSVGSRGSFNSSPLSGRGSPLPQNGPPFSPMGSPSLQKSVNGRRLSFGSPNSFGLSTSSSMFSESGPASPSPGKRTSVGLNNKWLYERGRRSSSNTFAY